MLLHFSSPFIYIYAPPDHNLRPFDLLFVRGCFHGCSNHSACLNLCFASLLVPVVAYLSPFFYVSLEIVDRSTLFSMFSCSATLLLCPSSMPSPMALYCTLFGDISCTGTPLSIRFCSLNFCSYAFVDWLTMFMWFPPSAKLVFYVHTLLIIMANFSNLDRVLKRSGT